MNAASVASIQYIEKQLGARKVESLDMLPRDVRKEIKREAKKIALNDVFGVGHATDKSGNPIEQGLGSAANITQQHLDAYIKNQTDRSATGPEAGYEENLARFRKQLAECEARRVAARANDDDDDD
jgi:hypothetical protein